MISIIMTNLEISCTLLLKHSQNHVSSNYSPSYSSPQCRPVAVSAARSRSSTPESQPTLHVHQLRSSGPTRKTYRELTKLPVQAFCHCTDDRKLNNTQVFQIPKAQFSITAGEPKIFTKQSDHGRVSGEANKLTSMNCIVSSKLQTLSRAASLVSLALTSYPQDIHTHFCPNCGTAMFRTGGAMAVDDFIGLRAGVLDDQTILDKAPMMEVYVERRMKWLKPIEGALQLDAKYAVVQ
jgi:hypothetical protein